MRAFMLSTATTRQAERVTAEEKSRCRLQELETSHGGIYSKLADEWQTPLAHIILNMEGISPGA